ncbi:MAG: 4Fe-4S binding protein [Kiritimatiellae bacterium]|jgi:NAD-dependent dihydropyrimidine dehydrogenase PreA subunit|nr:4Fe-4S binding protein [Kiritimatiellia bacterium]
MKRKIIEIDREKCNGCGQCVEACHEGAIQMVDGKAKLVSDIYCDGLGDCIGECPVDAIKIIEREAGAFDEVAVAEKMKAKQGSTPPPSGCPGMKSFSFNQDASPTDAQPTVNGVSALTQWPVQLHLVPVQAPFWQNSDLLIAADCTAIAYPDLHAKLLKGRSVAIACPKLDDTSTYVDKLTAIFKENDIKSITVSRMTVPCCSKISVIVDAARMASGKDIPCETVVINLDGTIQGH